MNKEFLDALNELIEVLKDIKAHMCNTNGTKYECTICGE